MRRNLIISLLSTLMLICSAGVFGRVPVSLPHDAKKSNPTAASLSTAFSLQDTEIEFTAYHSIAPVQITVEKKDPYQSLPTAYGIIVKENFQVPVPGEVLAVIAAHNYKLLFPFHHFW